NGIITSLTQATSTTLTSIGVASAAQAKSIAATATAVWSGQTVTGSDTLVMYTYGGDANLDGKIDISDYGRIDFNIPLHTSGWFNGDFNYDGKIDISDYGIIDFNIGIQGPPFSSAGAATPSGASLASLAGVAGVAGVASVPEPLAVVPLFMLGGAAHIRRRRRPQ